MEITFKKYQGAGNDFVIIDNRTAFFPKKDIELVAKICDRRFGIGSDGLILLENEEGYDFRMVYYNADGREGSMCGNGGRCIVAFAKLIGVIKDEASFIAIDGPHYARCNEDGTVSLGMQDVLVVEMLQEGHYFLNTGSPHYVIVGDELPTDIIDLAKEIRYNDRFKKDGVNVNFITVDENKVSIRTYERGVEDETLACGTGSVAAAIVASILTGQNDFNIETQGGLLSVNFENKYEKVQLIGPAEMVFEGSLEHFM